jgi:hypothetical protein
VSSRWIFESVSHSFGNAEIWDPDARNYYSPEGVAEYRRVRRRVWHCLLQGGDRPDIDQAGAPQDKIVGRCKIDDRMFLSKDKIEAIAAARDHQTACYKRQSRWNLYCHQRAGCGPKDRDEPIRFIQRLRQIHPGKYYRSDEPYNW